MAPINVDLLEIRATQIAAAKLRAHGIPLSEAERRLKIGADAYVKIRSEVLEEKEELRKEKAKYKQYVPDLWNSEVLQMPDGSLEENERFQLNLSWSVFQAKGMGREALLRYLIGHARSHIRSWYKERDLP